MKEPSLTLGIEEEYLLVDNQSRDLIREAPEGLMSACEDSLPAQVSPEFLQCQIEVGTRVCANVTEARKDLAMLRRGIAKTASQFGLSPIAASTHPFADWSKQHTTPKERYSALAQDLQSVARRMLICGMHVHVAVEEPHLRIDLFNQLSYFLPHLLALSTSSPFWQGRNTGLKSYRLTIFDNLPRTGLPPEVTSLSNYERMTEMLIANRIIEDSTKIWWDLRPSHRFPTLEIRICDLPTRIDDTITIAALFQCLTRMLYRLRMSNQRWRQYDAFLIRENRWRAQRYGMSKGMLDFGRGTLVDYADLLDELIELVMVDAEQLDCVDAVLNARQILRRGTSADWQVEAFERALAAGADHDAAMIAVVDLLREETLNGIE
ncbi:carboxylate-amine ligase [Gammaproteobacteria bacterium]|nr:carboxylate-amine ligase [Gammaproteobacteria bacterium]